MKQPNLLFIFSDQHRAEALGCYGSQLVNSPHIDRLANRGVRFENCISNIPVCVPARGTLLTGKMPWNHGALANDLPIKPKTESIANVLSDSGYHVGYIGKWHLGGVPRDKVIPTEERLGFQYWRVANCTHDYFHSYYDDENNTRHYFSGHEAIGQTNLALEFIDEQAHHGISDRPWALFISLGIPHDPYHVVPESYLNALTDTPISLRPNVPDKIKQTIKIHRSRKEILDWTRGYTALIHLLDDQIGRILNQLERSGVLDDTLVVYTSDHGDMLGSQGLTHKQLPFEESIRIPLIISWPGRVQPGAAQGQIGLVDLPVTILSLLGLSFSQEADGQDLANLLFEPDSPGLESSLICDLVPCHQATDRGHDAWVGVRTRTHTFARWADGTPYLCFNNQADPYQLNNLIGKDDNLTNQLNNEVDSVLDRYRYNFRPWQEMVRQDGYTQIWNKSQSYFNRPVLD